MISIGRYDLKLKITEEVSVFAFSNRWITQVTNPALSTVGQHAYQIGQTSAQLLLDRLLNRQVVRPFIHQVIKPSLLSANPPVPET